MERRAAIKSLNVTIAGVLFFPGCNFSSETKETANSFLSPEQDLLLTDIIDSIIPASGDIPGAKAINVQDYVKIMVIDCREPEIQKIFLDGLGATEELSKSLHGDNFAALSDIDKHNVLNTMKNTVDEEPDHKKHSQFFDLVKGLTVQGYMTSEYYLTNHTEYVMVPGPIYECVPVTTKNI